MKPQPDYAHELAVWEATEQATGGGGSFALEPPISYAMPVPAIELEQLSFEPTTYDEQLADGEGVEYDTGLAHLSDGASTSAYPSSHQQDLLPGVEHRSEQEALHSRRAAKPPPLDLSNPSTYSPPRPSPTRPNPPSATARQASHRTSTQPTTPPAPTRPLSKTPSAASPPRAPRPPAPRTR